MNKEELHNFIQSQQLNICQIVAYKNEEKVYSECWNGYKPDDSVHIMSATKSIMALLIGIALEKGQIKSIDEKVLDFFPEYKIKRGEKTIYDITIKHLLTMRAPYKCKGDPWTKVCSSDNWTYSSLDILGGRKGLTGEFNYQTVCLGNGNYNGKQIVSSQWIEEMTHPRTIEGKNFRGMKYGYLWWIIDSEKNIYAAIGNSGNVIYVNPEENIVVAVASYFKPTVFNRVDFIQEYIEPFIIE